MLTDRFSGGQRSAQQNGGRVDTARIAKGRGAAKQHATPCGRERASVERNIERSDECEDGHAEQECARCGGPWPKQKCKGT